MREVKEGEREGGEWEGKKKERGEAQEIVGNTCMYNSSRTHMYITCMEPVHKCMYIHPHRQPGLPPVPHKPIQVHLGASS